MTTRAKHFRTSSVVASAAALLALSLACGGSGDDTEESEGAATVTQPVEPPAPTDPFERAGMTMEQLVTQLERVAQLQPAGFQNNNSGDTRSLSESRVRNAPDPESITLNLGFKGRLGSTAPSVSVNLRRYADGRVRVSRVSVGDPGPGVAAFAAPPPVAEIAQLVRLRIMDGGCDLPVMTEEELSGEFPFIQTDARAVPENCRAAAEAFGATSLSLSYARINSSYEASMSGNLTSLVGQIASSTELRFTEPTYGLRR